MQLTSIFAAMLKRVLLIPIFFIAACSHAVELDFLQVFIGANGPPQTTAISISNVSDLENSWVRKSLNDDELSEILRVIDFEKYELLAFSAGKVDYYSGSIEISRIYEYVGVKARPVNLVVKVGVFDPSCGKNMPSRPFVLAQVKRRSINQAIGFDVQFKLQPCPP